MGSIHDELDERRNGRWAKYWAGLTQIALESNQITQQSSFNNMATLFALFALTIALIFMHTVVADLQVCKIIENSFIIVTAVMLNYRILQLNMSINPL